MPEKSKREVFVGAAITLLCVCLALGNYFILKSNLERVVDNKFKKLRNEISHTAFSGSTARLTGSDDDTDEDNETEEFGQKEQEEDKDTLSGKDMLKLISTVNRTLSQNIRHLNNMSKLLTAEIGDSQQKLKQFEEVIDRKGANTQTGSAGMAAEKTQPRFDAKGNKDNSFKVPAREGKQSKTRKEKHVYFSVALTKTLDNVTANKVIIFDMVYNNEGFGYDDKTGKFSVPVSGTYLFMFSVEAINKDGKSAHVSLVVDGENKAAAVAESWHNGQDVTSANAAVTFLTKGQNVWIQTAKSPNIVSGLDKRKTTFTGVLLFS